MDASLVHTGANSYATPIRVAATLFVAALTAAASQLSVPLPFTPVPFTLQPMIVLLGGAVLGPRLGMAAQFAYLAAGVAGFPVFAFSPELPQGAARLVGPTGGYLMAYPFAALVTGMLATRGFDRRYLTSVVAMAGGLAVIFAGGVTWLTLFAPGADGRSLNAALATGFYPFIIADAIKLCLAATVMPVAWRFLHSE
ncbi:MAG: biotin transporter BioY [Vicinamibacteria bacterium]|nr:biotin transporter BioY [Vicinamibacteria bacterium]